MDASGTKSSIKYLESHLEDIQCHALWDHWKVDEGLRIIMWALESEISKERPELLHFGGLAKAFTLS